VKKRLGSRNNKNRLKNKDKPEENKKERRKRPNLLMTTY